MQDDGSALHTATGLIGPTVSGTFLFAIGLINLVILVGIVKVFRQMRGGVYDEAELEHQLNSRGFMNRLYGRATRAVRKPWQMYPLGMLFGLGFDTATEIALLATAGTAAAGGLPIYAILCLPILFAAGMSLLDTIDGAFMNFAYGWAFAKPVRKLFYNITITGLSVAVALVIGTIELMSVLAEKLTLTGGVWDFVSNLDLNLVGYAVVAMFVADLGRRAVGVALRAHRGALGRERAAQNVGLDGRGERVRSGPWPTSRCHGCPTRWRKARSSSG